LVTVGFRSFHLRPVEAGRIFKGELDEVLESVYEVLGAFGLVGLVAVLVREFLRIRKARK